MSISVIIIHCAPSLEFRDVLIKTISSIRGQSFDQDIEIIIADDGSEWSQGLLPEGQEEILLDRENIKCSPLLKDLDADYYLCLNTSNKYQKAYLWNRAVEISGNEFIVFLDDDHAFKSRSALQKYVKYLNKYPFVIGRIQNPNNIYRLYQDRTVQGTNFGLRKALLTSVGGFGEYTAEWGRGEDSDIFWKIYSALSLHRSRAFYAGRIVTRDMCSGRWTACYGSDDIFIREFQEMFGVLPHDNAARCKHEWVENEKFFFLIECFYKLKNYITRKV